jgi:cytochrome c biogenesis protein CcmG/thiol:disulfide interchange protein DsbE
MRRLATILPVALFAALLVVFGIALNRDPSKLPSVLIGQPLPAFDLPAIQSGTSGLKSSDFRGQPMLLNVFASWCVACRSEHQMLLELKREGVIVDGIDWKDEAADGARWLDEHGDPYTNAGNDRTGRAGIDLGVTGVPETFVVDRNGRVRYKHIGPIEQDDWTDIIRPLIQRLRAES